MSEPAATNAPDTLSPLLAELQATLEREIPMCAMMGIRVQEYGSEGLVLRCPLDRNRNPHQTAFAGSLNALCTAAGWSTAYLLLKEVQRAGNLVIRRSSIRYQLPVDSPEIVARCHPVTDVVREFFLEMLDDKGQAKLDLTVEIASDERPAVVFNGSYVVVRDVAE
jgi:thioesterase domain-containing protein